MAQVKQKIPSGLLFLSLAHLVSDLPQGALPSLLPHLQSAYQLSYTQVAFLVFMQNLTSSVIQPVFGYLTDRLSLPWLIPVGILLSGLGMSAFIVADSYEQLLMLVTIGGLGIAAFHPQGSKAALLTSAKGAAGHSIGIFSVGGQMGFALGTVFITLLLQLPGDLNNIIWFGLPALILAPLLWRRLDWLCPEPPPRPLATTAELNQSLKAAIPWASLITILTYIFIRSTIHTGLITYIPLYYAAGTVGKDFFSGHLLTVFFLAGVFGTYLGGRLSDTFGRKTIIAGSMLIVLPLIAIIPQTTGIVTVALMALIGFISVSSNSPTIVMMQETLPHNVGMASGLSIGFSIGLGGLGVTLLGQVADSFGLSTVLTILAALPILGLICTTFLPGNISFIRNADTTRN